MLSYNLINVYISWKKGGVFLAAIDSAYHYYLSTYGTSKVSRYDTHKKSQLRAVYNQIVKTNKDTPLYKIPDSTDVKKFAIDLKEHTRSIQNVIAALSDNDEGIENVFNKIKGSCSMLILTEDGIIVARDKWGRTPIVIGRKEGAYAATSESSSFPNLDYEIDRYLGPGEIVRMTADGVEQLRKPDRKSVV